MKKKEGCTFNHFIQPAVNTVTIKQVWDHAGIFKKNVNYVQITISQ